MIIKSPAFAIDDQSTKDANAGRGASIRVGYLALKRNSGDIETGHIEAAMLYTFARLLYVLHNLKLHCRATAA